MMLFIKILLTEFIAEMGDKTQLMLAAMTSKYKLRDIILGTAVAIAILNGIAVVAGGLLSKVIPEGVIKFVAAAAFLFFAATSLAKEDDEEEDEKSVGIKIAPLAVAGTFFVAELGDKTQLTAITFGANEGLSNALIVWLACSIGLFAADMTGLLAAYLLKSKVSDNMMNMAAFFIFSVFGMLTLKKSFELLGMRASLVTPLIIALTVVFLAVCFVIFVKNGKKEQND